MLKENNSVTVFGLLVGNFAFSHKVEDDVFWENFIVVKRESDVCDCIPVIVSDVIGKRVDVSKPVIITGELRTHNTDRETGNGKLKIHIFADNIENTECESYDINDIALYGVICKQPTYRTTPKGRQIADLLIAVNRPYGKSDYIPCICWGRNAQKAEDFVVGTKVNVIGRIQSREYKKIIDNIIYVRTTREVSVNKIQAASD